MFCTRNKRSLTAILKIPLPILVTKEIRNPKDHLLVIIREQPL
ncbi:hypothetical protein NC652_014304 [Populus alba x Populus x berolinensis]|nr:hypothetical protein NC652_014304 [Populus alba x Populus x berolinensis]